MVVFYYVTRWRVGEWDGETMCETMAEELGGCLIISLQKMLEVIGVYWGWKRGCCAGVGACFALHCWGARAGTCQPCN